MNIDYKIDIHNILIWTFHQKYICLCMLLYYDINIIQK